MAVKRLTKIESLQELLEQQRVRADYFENRVGELNARVEELEGENKRLASTAVFLMETARDYQMQFRERAINGAR